MLKALLVHEIFVFLSRFVPGYVEKRLDRKLRLIRKLTLKTRQEIILINILSNISRNKGNQAMSILPANRI